MNIKAIKLVTGEDVIGEASFTAQGQLMVKNPVKLRMVPPQLQGGEPSLGFAPFPRFGLQKSDTVIMFEMLHVAYMYDPVEEISQNYNQIFGSGIITPTKQIIAG